MSIVNFFPASQASTCPLFGLVRLALNKLMKCFFFAADFSNFKLLSVCSAVVWWWWVGAARILHSYISAVKNWNGITLLLKYWLTRKVSFQFLNHQSCCFFQGKLKFVDSSVSQEYYSIQCHCSILKFCKFFLHFWANICLLQIFHFPIFPSWLCRSLQKCFLFTFSGFKYFLNRSDQTETMS